MTVADAGDSTGRKGRGCRAPRRESRFRSNSSTIAKPKKMRIGKTWPVTRHSSSHIDRVSQARKKSFPERERVGRRNPQSD